MRQRSLAIIVAVLAGAVSLHAQAPADRSALAAWDDSVQHTTTVAALTGLASSDHSGTAVDGLRQSIYRLRLGVLSHDRPTIDHVISNMTTITNVHSSWPWAPYLLARSFAALDLAGWSPLKPDDGKAPEERYADATWRTLDVALQRDPAFQPARHALLTWLVAGGDRLLRDEQLRLLTREVRRLSPDPDALLVWARYLRMQRHYDSALAVFRHAAQAGGDESLLALEEARTLRALHDSVGASAAYWRGVDHLTATGRELYRYDLAWIISRDSLKAFDAVPDSGVATWLHRFWDERDAAAANAPGARLIEHLRRWDVAYARYRVRSPWRRVGHTRIDLFFENEGCSHLDAGLYDLLWKLPPSHDGDLRADEWLLDHRGILYLRHGEPLMTIGGRSPRLSPEDFTSGTPSDQPDTSPVWWAWDFGIDVAGLGDARAPMLTMPGPVVHAGAPKMLPVRYTESWLYLMDGEQRVLNFRNSGAVGGYAATTLASILPMTSATAWRARATMAPEYAAAASRIAYEDHFIKPFDGGPPIHGDSTCWAEIRAADARSRATAELGSRTDTDEPPFIHLWPAVIRMLALGDAEHQTGEALLTFALGGDALHADTLPDRRILYPIHFHAVAWERTSGQTITLDTIRRFTRSTPLGPADRLVSWLDIPLPAGDWQIAIRAQQGDSSGAYAVRRDVRVDRGNPLALSDIVLGKAGEPQWLATDGAAFPINATGAWSVGSTAELFYEVHGVPSGAGYRTTVEWRPLDPKNRATVKVTTNDIANGGVTFQRRSINLGALVAGDYQLIVTIDRAGEEASRTESVHVVAAPRPVPTGRSTSPP